MSTPQVFRARTLPEFQKLAADPEPLPVIEREFRRTDRLLVRVGAQSAGGTPVISARLLNREGGEMSSLPVTPAGRRASARSTCPLAAIPAGDYLIEVAAKEGAEQTAALIAIRIVP